MLLGKARYAAFCRDVQRIIQMSQDIAVADEKHFYHSFVSPCFAPECPVLQGFSGVLLNALKLQIVANQSKIEHVATTC